MSDEHELNELGKLIRLFYHPNLEIPKNMRLYLVYEGEEFYVKNGRFRREYLNDFQYLFQDRGQILDAFARFEFLIGEIIRFKLIGFETEQDDMIIELISAINLNRQISLLTDWGIIDSDLKKSLNSLLEVRNGLAHKFFKEEVNYKNKKLIEFGENSTFDSFKKNMTNAWKKLVKIYEKEQEKIDYRKLANRIREINDFDQQ